MKKLVMGLLGAMMILSLAACTPTTEKNKTGEVKEPQQEDVVESTADAGPGVVTGRPVDQDAPDLKMVCIYSVSEDGSKIEGSGLSRDSGRAEPGRSSCSVRSAGMTEPRQSASPPREVLQVRRQVQG